MIETAATRLTGTLRETDYWDYELHGSLLPLQNNFRFGTSHDRKLNLAGSKTNVINLSCSPAQGKPPEAASRHGRRAMTRPLPLNQAV